MNENNQTLIVKLINLNGSE